MLGGESDIEYKVRDLLENPNPTAAIYCKTGECEIRITARAQNDTGAQTMCRAYAKKFYDLLGDAVYDEDVAGLEETVVHTLQEKGLTIATAESCTGGNIAHRMTMIPGVSEVLRGGVVAYDNDVKHRVLGVSEETLAAFGAVSEPVASQMAEGVRRALGADVAVSTSGIAGPGGGSEAKPVGTVCMAVSTPRGTEAVTVHLPGDRARVIDRATTTAIIRLIRTLQRF